MQKAYLFLEETVVDGVRAGFTPGLAPALLEVAAGLEVVPAALASSSRLLQKSQM